MEENQSLCKVMVRLPPRFECAPVLRASTVYANEHL